MYELNQVGEHTYYIDCPAKIGVYVPAPDSVYLIDSGSDKDAGRRVRKLLDERGWHLRAILNTHSHAGHIGGNRYLQGQTGCAVLANGIEADFTRHPLLEPSFLYGGLPPKALRHKFLMAEDSDAADFSAPCFPRELEILPLSGHSFDMVGFRTPDNVVFLADCLSSRATLEKYGVPFLYDVSAHLDTLERVEKLQASCFVPAHAEATAEIAPLARYNREHLLAIAEQLVALCSVPQSFEQLLELLFTRYGLTMNWEQYVLVGSTLRSFLSWLMDAGKLTAVFGGNRMLWQRLEA